MKIGDYDVQLKCSAVSVYNCAMGTGGLRGVLQVIQELLAQSYGMGE